MLLGKKAREAEMRKCDNCGKKLPAGSNHIEVRCYGYNFENLDFCCPECFEEFFTILRWKLVKKWRS